MSVYASRWALEFLERNDELGETARACMIILAVEANHHTGIATTGQERLAKRLRKHPDTIYRALRQLADVVPVERVPGKGMRWHFPVSADVHTPRAHAEAESSTPPASAVHNPPRPRGGSSSTPPAPSVHIPASTRGDPPRPRGVKGFGFSTYVENKEGPPDAVAQVGPIDTRPPWILQGISYGSWLRHERMAGRIEPAKPRPKKAQ